VITTPHFPVEVSTVIYSVLTPSVFVAARSWAAKSSFPTQPTYTVDFGGSRYYRKPDPWSEEGYLGRRTRGGYLCSTDGVLSCSAGDIVDFIFLYQLVVEGHMFFFSENCIVGFNVVFFEDGGIAYISASEEEYVVAWISRRGFPRPKRMYSCVMLWNLEL
jgi:hypothetical protein